jgi:uncharacterized protein
MAWHEGELEMQRRAGVREMADRVARIIGPDIPPAAAAFLAAQPFVVLATVDRGGAVSATLLAGDPGFARATSDRTLTLGPRTGHLDRVSADVDATGILGLLAIHPATRRRMRANGTAVRSGQTFTLTTSEVYSNCPQYIRPRNVTIATATTPTHLRSLTEAQRQQIRESDTFFIATAHPTRGADASHRGGYPGFVEVEGDRLTWPDYPGNNMFNTLGNLVVNPRCSLLFVDFDRGTTLQLRGTATVHGEEERYVEFEVGQVIETR